MNQIQQTSTEVSRALQEPLYGTARGDTDIYFLIEYNGGYSAEAWRDAEIPQAVKQRLISYPSSHALLIRQPLREAEEDGQLTLFIACSARQKPVMYRIQLGKYEDVLSLDFDAIIRGEVVDPIDDQFYMVCTNGRKDVCCSRYGIALYTALVEVVGENVWQVSHIGGHRFAGTMYCFPHALCYGYLDAPDAPEIVRSYEAGEVMLNKYRGRSIYAEPVQAAEYFLRRQLNLLAIDGLVFSHLLQDGEHWTAFFDVAGVAYQVQVERGEALMVLKTTGDAEYSPIRPFRLKAVDRL
jgi:hypothetical protein